MRSSAAAASRRLRRLRSGFTLVELLAVLGVFLIVSGAAFSLVSKHMPLFASQQSQSALNFSLRNAAAQMQIDVVNAGNGFYTAADVPGWPIGVTVNNQNAGSTTSCYNATTNTYGANCFDTLTVIATDPNTPPAHPSDSSGAGNYDSSSMTDLYLTPFAPTTAAQLAAKFKSGDQVLLVTQDGTQVTTTTLTANGSVSGALVHLTCNKTNADGSNPGGPNPALLNDKYGITTNTNNLSILKTQFTTNDWVLRLDPIKYDVDATTDPTNPKLRRTDLVNCPGPPVGTGCIIAEQIIGFKVGASVWNGDDDTGYSYNTADYKAIWSNIRAVRVTLIGRTDPNGGAAGFRNTFDGGPYRIEAVSVVINPRNLSMNDQ